MRFCGTCGSTWSPGAVHCPQCGVALAASPAVAPDTPPPARTGLAALLERCVVPASALPRVAALAALTLGLVLAALTVLSAAAAVVLLPAVARGAPIDWLRAGVAGLGLAVHAPLRVSAAGRLGSFLSGDTAVSVTLTPLLVTLAVAAGVFACARWRGPDNRDGCVAQLVPLSAASAGVFALGAGVAAVLFRGSTGLGATGELLRMDIGAPFGRTALGCFLVGWPAVLAGLLSRPARAPRKRGWLSGLMPRIAAWEIAVRHAVFLMVAVVAIAVLVCAVAVAWELAMALLHPDRNHLVPAAGPNSAAAGVPAALAALMAVVLMVPNLLVLGGGFAMGATVGLHGYAGETLIGVSSASGHKLGLLAGGVPPVAYLALLLLVPTVVVGGLRYAARDAPGALARGRALRCAVVFAGTWLLLGVVTGVRVRVDGNATLLGVVENGWAGIAAGLGLPSLGATAAFWAGVSALLGRATLPGVAAIYPRLVAWLAGGRAHPDWQLILADALLRSGRPLPARLAAATDALRGGVRRDAPPRRLRAHLWLPFRSDRSVMSDPE